MAEYIWIDARGDVRSKSKVSHFLLPASYCAASYNNKRQNQSKSTFGKPRVLRGVLISPNTFQPKSTKALDNAPLLNQKSWRESHCYCRCHIPYHIAVEISISLLFSILGVWLVPVIACRHNPSMQIAAILLLASFLVSAHGQPPNTSQPKTAVFVSNNCSVTDIAVRNR